MLIYPRFDLVYNARIESHDNTVGYYETQFYPNKVSYRSADCRFGSGQFGKTTKGKIHRPSVSVECYERTGAKP